MVLNLQQNCICDGTCSVLLKEVCLSSYLIQEVIEGNPLFSLINTVILTTCNTAKNLTRNNEMKLRKEKFRLKVKKNFQTVRSVIP